jgi:hypothetical protein
MSLGFTDIREYLAEALADDAQYQTFAWPPATPIANSIAFEPASPWVEPLTIGKGVMVNWTVKIYANAVDNRNDLVTLENMVTTVISNIPAGTAFSEVSQPQVIDLTNNMLTTCDITLSVAVNIED